MSNHKDAMTVFKETNSLTTDHAQKLGVVFRNRSAGKGTFEDSLRSLVSGIESITGPFVQTAGVDALIASGVVALEEFYEREDPIADVFLLGILSMFLFGVTAYSDEAWVIPVIN